MAKFSGEIIHISDLRVECIVGVKEKERETPQPLLLSLSFPHDFLKAALGDQLEETVDYGDVARAVEEFTRDGDFRLLEKLARDLAAHLGERFGLEWVSLEVRKPGAIANAGWASVSLLWERAEKKGEEQ